MKEKRSFDELSIWLSIMFESLRDLQIQQPHLLLEDGENNSVEWLRCLSVETLQRQPSISELNDVKMLKHM